MGVISYDIKDGSRNTTNSSRESSELRLPEGRIRLSRRHLKTRWLRISSFLHGTGMSTWMTQMVEKGPHGNVLDLPY